MGASHIQEAVRILSGENNAQRVYANDCEVLSVDAAKRTAQVRAVDGKARNMFTARLMSTVDDGLYFEPEIGSTVCVIFGDFTLPYIAQYSGIESIILRGGLFGGLVKVEELTVKLNNLEKLMNNLITKYNTHVHSGVTVGGGVSGPTGTPETGTLLPTEQAEIENDKIKHG